MEKLVIGSLGNYLTMEEHGDLMESIVKDYDDVIYPFSIGKTVENRPIMAYAFMLGTTNDTYANDLKERQSILLDGVHHARELTTISQITYTMLRLLHGLEHGQDKYKHLLTKSAVVFIPIVNVDGVSYISETYEKTGHLEYIRKNRNIYSGMKNC